MKYLAFIWFAFIMIESAERNEEIFDFFDDFDESLGWYPMQNGIIGDQTVSLQIVLNRILKFDR